MISALLPGAQQFVNTLSDLQLALTKAQAEVASGLKVNTPSDAPDQVSPILQLHANIQHNQQIQQNLNQVLAEVQTADGSLSSATSILDQVQTLLSQGTSLSQTAQTRAVLGDQIGDLMKQMVAISQTSIDGRYIFSGDNQQAPVYTYVGGNPQQYTATYSSLTGDAFNPDTQTVTFTTVDPSGNPQKTTIPLKAGTSTPAGDLTAAGAASVINSALQNTGQPALQNIVATADPTTGNITFSSKTSSNFTVSFGMENGVGAASGFQPTDNGVSGTAIPDTTRQIEDASGGTFAVALTASQLFDARDPVSGQPTSGNVFAAMNAVRIALLSNDTNGLQAAAGAVKSASDYLNQQQMFYGAAENRISSAQDVASNADLSYQKELSSRQDADQATVILQMQQYTINLQAAMASQARMPQTTLFDLLS